MALFNQTLQFQFVLFFAPEDLELASALQAKAVQLPAVLGNNGVRNEIGLNLKSPAIMPPQAIAPMGVTPLVQWAAGVWRVGWNLARMDFVFDALGYSELRDEISVETVAGHLAGDLPNVPEHLGMRATRAALVVTGERTEASPAATLKAAERFGLERLREAAKEGAVPDLLVRANRSARWQLGASEVEVNRIETINSVSGWQAPTPSRNLFMWQLDVNTDARSSEGLGGEALKAFFTRAAAEIGGAIKELENEFA